MHHLKSNFKQFSLYKRLNLTSWKQIQILRRSQPSFFTSLAQTARTRLGPTWFPGSFSSASICLWGKDGYRTTCDTNGFTVVRSSLLESTLIIFVDLERTHVQSKTFPTQGSNGPPLTPICWRNSQWRRENIFHYHSLRFAFPRYFDPFNRVTFSSICRCLFGWPFFSQAWLSNPIWRRVSRIQKLLATLWRKPTMW